MFYFVAQHALWFHLMNLQYVCFDSLWKKLRNIIIADVWEKSNYRSIDSSVDMQKVKNSSYLMSSCVMELMRWHVLFVLSLSSRSSFDLSVSTMSHLMFQFFLHNFIHWHASDKFVSRTKSDECSSGDFLN